MLFWLHNFTQLVRTTGECYNTKPHEMETFEQTFGLDPPASTKLHSAHDWRVSGLGKRQFFVTSSPGGQQAWFDLPGQLRTASNLLRIVSLTQDLPGTFRQLVITEVLHAVLYSGTWELPQLADMNSSFLTPLAGGSWSWLCGFCCQHSSARRPEQFQGTVSPKRKWKERLKPLASHTSDILVKSS